MAYQLTPDGLRAMLPRAPQAVIDAFVTKQTALSAIKVNETRTRLAYFFANLEHETDGFTIKNLTENINYTHSRAAQIWPSRFPGGAAQVQQMFGSQPGWQTALFDNVYGNRMGNRPGTHDGSRYIGRGGPQWTGREGYQQLEKTSKLSAVAQPEIASRYDMQPEVCAAFWDWKNLNPLADVNNFNGVVKRWNGGHIGIEDRRARLAGNDRAINSLPEVNRVRDASVNLPGKPSTPLPPKEAIDATTVNERRVRNGGAAGGVAGGAGEITNAGTQVADKPPLLSPFLTYTLIGVGVAVVITALVLIAKKRAAVISNWF